MNDVSEMVKFLRKVHEGEILPLSEWVTKIPRAADALETLAGNVKDLETELECVKKQREDYFSEYRGKLTECIEMKIALANLAPVVEAARALSAEWENSGSNLGNFFAVLDDAIATLEAAHD